MHKRQADVAIVLIDAARVDFSGRELILLPQTKRHSAILKLLGCPNIIVAVNKPDLLDFDETKYQAITDAHRKLAERIDLQAQIRFLSTSALEGDNIVNASNQAPWHQGLPLLPLLESLPVNHQSTTDQAAHSPVQHVVRQDGSSSGDFHSYRGRLEMGHLKTGDEIKVPPDGHAAKIAEVYNPSDKTESAEADEILTVALDANLDISRGNNIAAIGSSITPGQQFQAALCWFDDTLLNLRRKYLLKHTTQITPAEISVISYVWGVNTLSRVEPVDTLKLNDTGGVNFGTQQPVAAMPYEENYTLGVFISIDEATNRTVAAGTIRGGGQSDSFEI